MKIKKMFRAYSLSVVWILCLVLFTEWAMAQELEDYPRKPNFIIIFADDLGYGDLGVYGHPTIHTPNLDRMAIEGQKWTNFYVGASVCTPSRAALLTGRLPVRSGMASNKSRVLFPNSVNGLPLEEITLAEQLKTVGYGTACIGKWHLGHKEKYLPTNHGFDYYYGIPYSNDMDLTRKLEGPTGYWDLWTKEYKNLEIADFNVPLIRNKTIIERPANQHTITKRYTDESIKWIEQNKKSPFFLYLAYNLPHVPLFASEEFMGTSKRGLYGDVVEEIDHNVGRIITLLENEGLAENTIVVFTSDNGPWIKTEISGGSAGLLRDGKGTTWEGGMREPCIFWSPGNIKPKVVMDMGTTMDLFSTFSKLASAEMPADREMDGIDLGPVLFSDGKSSRNEVFYYRGRDLYAVRVGAYKAHFITQEVYVHNPKRVEHNPPLLYNLDEDPSERFDISEKFPEVIAEIEQVVREHNSKMIKAPDLLALKEKTK
ncbi:sulfatase [Allomuricauda sp. SCSIO 65647]|uniref:sulfatase family protein n=1 Tax=Allomuricauda sp. SCSIO 65647 TaxID=2908843 RepID=UPI001F1C460E|nr:sulfatase [Muricauda sp. SCSIO 65647]UJH68564.1 sulfatase [Muricauda sp. SCSIO 65647]